MRMNHRDHSDKRDHRDKRDHSDKRESRDEKAPIPMFLIAFAGEMFSQSLIVVNQPTFRAAELDSSVQTYMRSAKTS